jgi:hypothetical protein
MDFPDNNELSYTAFFNISLRITEAKRPFSSIGEDLILPFIDDANKEVIHDAENGKINSIPFSNDPVARRLKAVTRCD